ncbi:Phenylalanine--tRNA ligase beta subunit [Seminavis robusta]|uniref:phenylalanine--tRNA ligase n=1 Tax=Seminavis robusta TaxID=568900 RepID=A0A9N8DRG2_9STRA|nr:Phenylalanine--tRNA ligase beta subunit [Seminavis robusta]|eukprot:Sro299_g111380.1 Phenylalanine--tRNA ligase beta subunit (637) ;mRNA; f:40314-42224
MPTLAVEKDIFFAHLGRTYTEEAFDELCFEFGVELDEVTSEREEAQKSATVKLTKDQIASLSDKEIYKIDVPANRYDLLCVEGMSRALKIFLGDMEAPVYQIVGEPSEATAMTVMKTNTDKIRPFVVCAILRDVTFDKERYDSFMDLQDQLHRNLCRQRTLVAIGTHDLDSIKPPFKYDARDPTQISFVPLTPDDQTFTAKDLMTHYETVPTCKHLKPYVPIIKDSPVYPVIMDSEETVMSLPPIINGSKSKITLDTKNVFIECTATDITKANIVLDTVVTMFSEYCAKPFTVEPVTVNYQDESGAIVDSHVTPLLYTRQEQAKVDFCNSLIGISITAEEMKNLCNKVQLGPAKLLDNDTTLEVTVPPTRSDILHPVDIAEDIGIAFGYNNIVKKVPATCTVGGEFPLNLLGDLLRDEIGRAGYTEVLTHGLCSTHDNFTALRRPVTAAVSLSNPANKDYQVVRTTLLPGLLMTVQHNKSASFTAGFKLFEISDVVLPDSEHVITETIVGAKNARRVCAVYAGPTSGFEIIHGLVDRIMTLSEVAPEPAYCASAKKDEGKHRVSREGWLYTIAPLEEGDPEAGTYFPGRAAAILLTTPEKKQTRIGTFGILHPEVLNNFDIQYPSSCVELDLEALL